MRKLLTLGAMTLVGATAQASAAGSVLTFSGYVDSSYPVKDDRGLFKNVKAGDSFSVSYAFDRKNLNNTGFGSSLAYWFAFDSATVRIGEKYLSLDDNIFYQYVFLGAETRFDGLALQSLRLGYVSYPQGNASGEIISTSFSIYAADGAFFTKDFNALLADDFSLNIADQGNAFANSGNFTGGFGTGASGFLGIPLKPTSLTVSTAAVPEPATWAMMILGFGVVGYAMRRKTVMRFV